MGITSHQGGNKKEMVMRPKIFLKAALAGSLAFGLVSCGSGGGEEAVPPVDEAAAKGAFPQSLTVVGDGYPNSGDACRQLGESEATVDFLDDSALLVGCPTKEAARALGGRMVGVIDNISLVSMPIDRAMVGKADGSASEATAVKTVSKDVIRGKGGLEDKCHAKIAGEGMKVIGTNRIEESEAAIAIFVNVDGGEAPWRCLGYRDGTIGDLMYTGSEGAL
jgi:hypothetical protein